MIMSSSKVLKTLARYRLQLAFFCILIILAVKIFVIHQKPLSPIEAPLGIIGTLIIICGVYLRSWAAGIINKNTILTTIGPYSLFRHPLYIGSFLMAIGFSILIREIFVWLLLAFFVFFVYRPKINAEEEKLARLFPGQWEDFIKQTAVFYPKKFSFKRLNVSWDFKHWWHHTEYNAILATVAGLIGIYLWNIYL